MNISSFLRNVALVTLFATSLNAQDSSFGIVPLTSTANELDREALSLIKDELKSSLKMLVAIRNTQDPLLQSSMNNVLKEALYILGALTIGGGCIVAIVINSAGLNNVWEILGTTAGRNAALIGLPFLLVGTIIVYTLLKLTFSRLLAQKNDTTTNIKDSLTLIEQTINKLNYEIKKVERICNMA